MVWRYPWQRKRLEVSWACVSTRVPSSEKNKPPAISSHFSSSGVNMGKLWRELSHPRWDKGLINTWLSPLPLEVLACGPLAMMLWELFIMGAHNGGGHSTG